MFIKNRWLSVAIGVFALIFIFQNCSGVISNEMSFSVSSYATPPICRSVSADEARPVFMYQWDKTNSLKPEFNNVMSSPVVGDLDKDGFPEIVFTAFHEGGNYTGAGVIRVISGKNGAEKFSVVSDSLLAFASISPLLIDIDGDGFVEIFYLDAERKNVISLNHDGTLRWTYPNVASAIWVDDSLSASDLNGDGVAEILAPGIIISESLAKKPYLVNNLDFSTAYTFAANIQSTQYMNIVSAFGVMDMKGKKIFTYKDNEGKDLWGHPSIADLYKDIPGVEIVVVSSGKLIIYSSSGQILYHHNLNEHTDIACSGSVGGGQATIGDFDGVSSTLEIAIATGRSLTIFDSKGSKIAGSLTVDCSSRKTGVASFDFNGDGKPEIVYADEQKLRIYEMDGSQNLKVVWEISNPSGTLSEYPVVADVDNDGYANLVVAQNSYFIRDPLHPNYNQYGVRVFGPNKAGSWMPTRNLWNESSYMLSNVTDKLRPQGHTLINGEFATTFKRNIIHSLGKEVRCKKENLVQ
ncbi:MAG: FG-GAP repeat domain-containing protein, partial [Pseudobdellovibrio sp.]